MDKVDRWIKRITWASCALFGMVFFIEVVGVFYYIFYLYLEPGEILVMTDPIIYFTMMLGYKGYRIDVFNSPIPRYIGKVAWGLSLLSLLVLYLWQGWYEQKHRLTK